VIGGIRRGGVPAAACTLALIVPCLAPAQTEVRPDSTEVGGAPTVVDTPSVPDIAADSTGDRASAPGAPDTITVRFDKGRVEHVAFVEPLAVGNIRLVWADGRQETLGDQHVRSITDGHGRTLTQRVIRDGRPVGAMPQGPIGPRNEHKPVCFAARPGPYCTTCVLTQIEFVDLLGSHPGTNDRGYVVFEVGGVHNIGSRNGVGLNLYAAGNGDQSRFGVQGRYRRWIGSSVALDLAPGVLLFASDNESFDYPGFVGEVTATYRGLIGVTGGVEAISWKTYGFYSDGSWRDYTSRVSSTRWYAGVTAGGGAGLGLTMGLLAFAFLWGLGAGFY
jgi:hypothetical protein